ncbi:MAG: formylglycine-generating enzyme family protein [Smithella sp.]
MRNKNTCLLFALILTMLLALPLSAAELKNEKARQEGNRLVITYDLDGKENAAEVALSITVDGKTYKSSELHIEGDIGKLSPGKGKRVTWNILQDFPKGLRAGAEWELSTSGDAFKDPTTGMEMIFVKGGCFQMGDTVGGGEADEKPVHQVCLSNFYMGKYEVTQGQWQQIMGNNPSHFSSCGDNCPVEKVSWNDVQDFIRRLNSQTGKNYRLPTEAEWEYAARSGGKSEQYSGGADVDSVAWYDGNSGRKTHPVGQKKPNGLGLHDMSGNVWEWCQDWYSDKYYSQSNRDNPSGPSSGSNRVLRGGSWFNGDARARGDSLRDRSGRRLQPHGFPACLAPRSMSQAGARTEQARKARKAELRRCD